MNWVLRFGFEKGVVLINALLVCFRIVSKFPRQKSNSISPYFHDQNQAALCLRCIIAHKTLFSTSFRCENTTTKMPHFHSKNLTKFQVWYIMAHRQGFTPVYVVRVNILMRVVYTGKPMSLSLHGLRQSHRNDHVHNLV